MTAMFNIATARRAVAAGGRCLRAQRLASRAAAPADKSYGGGCSHNLTWLRLGSGCAGGRVECRKRRPRGESGFTLQTLIITAVVVVVAIGVGLLFIALTNRSSDDLEAAGRSGTEAACAPHELLDAGFVRRGIGGPNSAGGVESKAVGCKPYCATWEFGASFDGYEYEPGGSGPSSPFGGPDGKGGVFSSNVGCFAPCYWEIGTPDQVRLRHRSLIGVRIQDDAVSRDNPPKTEMGFVLGSWENPDSRLRYYNDNRPPDAGVIRLGVTYRRILDREQLDTSSRNYANYSTLLGSIRATELQSSTTGSNDGKPYFYYTPLEQDSVSGRWGHGLGVRNAPGTPLSPEQITNGVPTVHTPNWRTIGTDEMAQEWGRFNTEWEDEDWEVRVDPENEVCEIVYTPTDRIICSSTNDSCKESNESDTCPSTLISRTHQYENLPVCRLP